MLIIAGLMVMMLVFIMEDVVKRKMPKFKYVALIIGLVFTLILGLVYFYQTSHNASLDLVYAVAPFVVGIDLGSILGLIKK